MRIRWVHVHGFGCLADRRYEFPEGKVALVVEDNERGKSTLAAAVLAGLCGFPSRKASGEAIKLKEVYRPWDAGCYRLEMELEAGGRLLRIERDFASDGFAVRDPETNRDISAQFEQDLASHFLRLPREDFQRVALITGKEAHRFGSSTTIQERLSVLVEGSQDDYGAETAIAALESAGYSLWGKQIKIASAGKRLNDGIADRTRRIGELDSLLDAAGGEDGALDRARAERESLVERIARLEGDYSAARLREVRERIAGAEDSARRMADLEAEMGRLEPYALFPAERAPHLGSSITRLEERGRELAASEANAAQLNREADEVRARVDGLRQFALATDSDLLALRAAAEGTANSAKALEREREEMKRLGQGPSRAIGYALLGVGGLMGLACLALMITRALDVVPSLVGGLVGVLVAAAGIVQVLRAGGASAGAKARLEQADEMLTDEQARASRLLANLGVQHAANGDLAGQLSRAEQALSGYLGDCGRLREIDRDLAALDRDRGDTRRRMDEEKRTIASVLSEAGLDPLTPLDRARDAFEEAARLHRRFREIRDSLLPALRSLSMDAAALARLKSEESTLAAQVGKADSDRPAAEVDAERKAARHEYDRVTARMMELEKSVGAAVDTYRREYPLLQEELRDLRVELAKVTRFGEALETASRAMREVAESTRRRWAAALNDQAGRILPHLNPDYSDLRFDDSLGFTIRRTSDGRIIEKADVDARLSTGARDQVYLAVRLACCLELSRLGESVPILLDDPFIASDDTRFRSGFRLLADHLARGQQVIALTCHRARHEQFAGEEWFCSGVEVVGI